MKQIEDIEKMTPGELEAASSGIPVPQGLQERIRERIAASAEVPQSGSRSARLWIPIVSLAAAAAVAAVVVVPQIRRAPADTYQDPYLAYAQVEATLRLISDKMAAGMELAGEAGSTVQKPLQILNKISEK